MRLIQFAPDAIPAEYPNNFKRTEYHDSLGVYVGEYYGSDGTLADFTGPQLPAPWLYGSRVTKLSMRMRFTTAEKIAIESAAETSAAVRVWKDDLAAATFIDLKLQDTVDSINGLVAAALLTAERAATILNTPPTETEAYIG